MLTMGPDRATEAIRKALSMGADKAVHVVDDGHRTAPTRSRPRRCSPVRSASIEGVDLVIAGNEATDGRSGAMPAMLAECLGVPQLTHAAQAHRRRAAR